MNRQKFTAAKAMIVVAATAAALTLSSCRQLDVIGNTSVTSFKALLGAAGDKVAADESFGGWALSAPDGSARVVWSTDTSKSSPLDVMVETDAQPFINAGLDTKQLPDGMAQDGKIVVGADLGDTKPSKDGEADALAAYDAIVATHRDAIGYHAALDHFGITLNGGMFEWAKNLESNDKDMVFVLDPKKLTEAGVNPEKVEGWLYAKVEMMDEDGRKVEMYKFLKPFNLK